MSSDSAQSLEDQRHTLVQEAAAEMMRSQQHHRHAEGQSDEFQQSQLRQQWERSYTEGAQLRNVREQTRTAIARSAPEVVRLQAR